MNKDRAKLENSELDDRLKFKITEAYKVVRTNILFSLLKEGCKKIVISSSLAGEGKTTSAVHVAISLAQMNKKVLLIDADLRKPTLNQFFSLKNSLGLTNHLGHMAEVKDIINETAFQNLSVICAGLTVPNPSELLASSEMSFFLKDIESQYDYIIIDTPPLNVVIDALPLIDYSDGVILIVKAGASTFPALNKTIKSLEIINGKILGIIMNTVETKKKEGYGYSNYGYYGKSGK